MPGTKSYDDLIASYINCTLKPSPQVSHTETLMRASMTIMEELGVDVQLVRAVDHEIAPGVYPDMTEHGFETDGWPELFTRIKNSDIVVIGSPIWLGEKSSICTKVMERLYAHSGETNDKGQYAFYGKVGGCIVTGNEDGIKHVGMSVLYGLQHIGFTIPPAADAGWVGEAGPGPSYGDQRDDGSFVGYDNDFTCRNTTFMTWNLLHLARMLKDAGGVPAYGNLPKAWDDGERFGFRLPRE